MHRQRLCPFKVWYLFGKMTSFVSLVERIVQSRCVYAELTVTVTFGSCVSVMLRIGRVNI